MESLDREVKEWATSILAIVSISANGLLIWLTISARSPYINSYRLLIRAFAIMDICTSIVHFIILPEIHTIPYAFIFFSLRSTGYNAILETIVACSFQMFYYQSLILLAYHFVYRMFSLKTDTHWSQRMPRRWWVVLAVIGDILYTAVMWLLVLPYMPNDAGQRTFHGDVLSNYGIDITNGGYFAVVYAEIQDGVVIWKLWVLLEMLGCAVWYALTAFVIFYCFFKTRKVIESPALHSYTRLLQRQLLRALIAQAMVPVIFAYTPFTLALILPVTGWDLGQLSNCLFTLTFIFPALDPFLIVYFIRPYRYAVLEYVARLLRCSPFTTLRLTESQSVVISRSSVS